MVLLGGIKLFEKLAPSLNKSYISSIDQLIDKLLHWLQLGTDMYTKHISEVCIRYYNACYIHQYNNRKRAKITQRLAESRL